MNRRKWRRRSANATFVAIGVHQYDLNQGRYLSPSAGSDQINGYTFAGNDPLNSLLVDTSTLPLGPSTTAGPDAAPPPLTPDQISADFLAYESRANVANLNISISNVLQAADAD